MCYEEAGKSASDIADAAYESNPMDEFGLLNHLMNGLDKKHISEEDAIRLINGVITPKSGWMLFLADILGQEHDSREEFIKSRLTPDSNSDEFLVGFACLAMDDNQIFDEIFINVSDDYMRRIQLFGEKLPPIYDVIADKMWRRYYEDTDDKEKYLSAALDRMFHADQMRFLSKQRITQRIENRYN